MDSLLNEYEFNLPESLIAKEPASPRDLAKLMVYRRSTDEVFFDVFRNIGKYLPPRSLLVFNDTKVIPARFKGEKTNGGKAVITIVDIEKEYLKVLSDRKLELGHSIKVSSQDEMKIAMQDGKYFFLRPAEKFKINGEINKNLIFGLLDSIGIMPLPPYIKESPLSEEEIKKEYQTVFAKEKGSYAAPTASLHFTKELIGRLAEEHETCFITLHAGLGTFAPLTEKNIIEGKLHREYYRINADSAEKISRAQKEEREIIAIGTTSVRALESSCLSDGISEGEKETDIFIREGYRFKVINGMVTNFHVPKSSLIMLVSAFIGREKTLELYGLAVRKGLRFFSFGDGMLII
jgi:S-adenosylmethionine:tRNA ribosyltransferase-isomerase